MSLTCLESLLLLENLQHENLGKSMNRRESPASLLERRVPINYDSTIMTWSRITARTPVVPPPRSGAASVIVGGKLYLFGGYGGGTGRLDDFWCFDFESLTWSEVDVQSEERPGSRENNGVVISSDTRDIVLFGGYTGSAWANDLWTFSIDTNKWTCLMQNSDGDDPDAATGGTDSLVRHPTIRGSVPSRRFGYVSIVHNNKLIIIFGFDGQRWRNDAYEFSFETRAWREIEAKGALPSVRSCPAWAVSSTHCYVHGGYNGIERLDDYYAFRLSDYTWIKMPTHQGTAPSPRYFHSCALHGNKLYIYGGYSGSERLADLYAYDFETSYWQKIESCGNDAPSGRSSLVFFEKDNCLWAFGGYNGQTVLNSFYKFRLKPIGVPPSSLVSDLGRLVNNPELSDVVFVIDGLEVYANKAILVTRCEYFNAMLCGPMMENRSSGSANSRPIEIKDISHRVFLKVLEFLYTDAIGEVSEFETAIHLLIASERFMLNRLKALCEERIRRDIHVDTVTDILLASQRHHAHGLKNMALDFIMRNLQDPTIAESLEDLKSEPDLLLEIIKRNCSSENSPSTGLLDSDAHESQAFGPFGGGTQWRTRR